MQERATNNDENVEEEEEQPAPEEPGFPPNMPPSNLPFRLVATIKHGL